MKFRLIEDQRERFPVRVVCDVMGVSPAGYYAWRGRPESPRKMANRALLTEIRRVHTTHRGRYGAPRNTTRPCAPMGRRRAVAASNASCIITAFGHERHGGFGCALRTAITTCRSPPTGSTRNSPPGSPIRFGSPTSPTCQPRKGGSIWPSCSISSPAKSSAGRCVTTCGQN